MATPQQAALDALLANHAWHQEYDDTGGYPGSELEQQNLEAIAKLQASPQAQPEQAWLVEFKPHGHAPWWWGFNYPGSTNAGWCQDANNAVRFSRKEDAERMRLYVIAERGLRGNTKFEESVIATEHTWIGTDTQATQPEQAAPNLADPAVQKRLATQWGYVQAAQGMGEPLQQRVQPWLMACFGEMIAGDKEERNHRFLEEALELVQACGCTASEAHQLVDYTFGRPVGEKNQEVGGVMITLAALCLANDLDMHAAGEAELARIWTMVEKIREKQAAKPKHSPLPAPVAAQGVGEVVHQAQFEYPSNNPGVRYDVSADLLERIPDQCRRALYTHPAPSAEVVDIPEGCTPADAAKLREANHDLAERLHKMEERMHFLHTPNKDAEGWEWGVCKVKFGDDGQVKAALWGAQDHSDIDVALTTQHAQTKGEQV